MAKQYSRKIVRHGPGTSTISLPSDWLKERKLKLSDSLTLYEEGNDLVIKGGVGHGNRSITITLTALQERFVRIIVSKLYKNGFDEIIIVYHQSKTREIIRKEVSQNLLNFSVVEETNTKCVLRMLSQDNPAEMDSLVKRALFTTQEIANLLVSQEDGWLENIRELEHINNQVTNYVQRLLTKFPSASSQGHSLYVTLWQIEKVADDCKQVAVKLHAMSAGMRKRCLPTLELLRDIIDNYKTAFFSPNITVAEQFFNCCKKVIAEVSSQSNAIACDVLETIRKLELITSILIMKDDARVKK